MQVALGRVTSFDVKGEDQLLWLGAVEHNLKFDLNTQRKCAF